MDLNLPFGGTGQPLLDDDEGRPLRPLDWSALVARLTAERDLRREIAHGASSAKPISSFVRDMAQFAVGSPHAGRYDAQGVNPDALANLKSTGGITIATVAKPPVATNDARGQQ